MSATLFSIIIVVTFLVKLGDLIAYAYFRDFQMNSDSQTSKEIAAWYNILQRLEFKVCELQEFIKSFSLSHKNKKHPLHTHTQNHLLLLHWLLDIII